MAVFPSYRRISFGMERGRSSLAVVLKLVSAMQKRIQRGVTALEQGGKLLANRTIGPSIDKGQGHVTGSSRLFAITFRGFRIRSP